MFTSYSEVQKALKLVASPQKAAFLPRFFKTGPGEYGEGDKFLGVVVPEQRHIARQAKELPLYDIEKLIQSPWHEERLTGLLILVGQYQKAEKIEQKHLADWYLAHTKNINNWDLVDLSAPNIIGHFCLTNAKDTILLQLAKSSKLWEQRIAILATLTYIRAQELALSLIICDMLVHHTHDLIHKAVGWMLREIGKKDEQVLKEFLYTRYTTMPRTMLRYAIERFAEEERQRYLKGTL